MKKTSKKKQITIRDVIRFIVLTILSLLLIAAIVARVWHLMNHHSK